MSNLRVNEAKLVAMKKELESNMRIYERVLNKDCTAKHLARMPILSTFPNIVTDTINNIMPLHGAN